MENHIKTYNFLVFQGNTQFGIDIDACSQYEAIDIISDEYPRDEGWNFMLI